MNNRGRMKRVSASRRFLVCCTVLGLALGAASAAALVTVKVATDEFVTRGSPLTLTLSLTRDGGETVSSAQTDVIFVTEQMVLPGTCSNEAIPCQMNDECGEGSCVLDCEGDVRLEVQDFNATFPEFQNVEPGEKRVRLRVLAPIQGELPLPTFEDGDLATCTFQVDENAPFGPIALSAQRLNVGDDQGDEVEAAVVVESGEIVTPTATATHTAEEEPTSTPTHTPMSPGGTPTDTPTVTPSGPTATYTAKPPVTIPITPVERDDDGCSCRIDPRTGKATGGMPWHAALLPFALLLLKRRDARRRQHG
jgi:hypothetical protein